MITGGLPAGHRGPPGNGPPPGADPSALWVKLSKLPRPVSTPQVLRARGVDVGTVVFHVLSATETSNVIANAHAATIAALGEGAKGSLAYEEYFVEQRGIELVVLAVRQPPSRPSEPTLPVFLAASDVRDNLTDDEIAVLVMGYALFRRESGPILSEITKEELDAWIAVLSEGASRAPLARCSSEALIDLVMSLVSTLRSGSSTATSSAGSPPAAPSPGPTAASAPDGA